MNFKSQLKDLLQEFYEEKKGLGYSYQSELSKLKQFDNYLFNNYPDEKELTREIILDYMNSLNINVNSKSCIASVLRQFSRYLNKNHLNAYVIPERMYHRKKTFLPHIYTSSEINNFLVSINTCYYNDNYRKTMLNLLFTLLYCTGMRISECLSIKIEDIELDKKYILLKETKNSKIRYIYFNESIYNMIKTLIENYSIYYQSNNSYLFQNNKHNKFSNDNIRNIFKRILYYSNLDTLNNYYRIHDFRHTYCVNALKKIIDNNLDITVYLPVLSTYVGHKNIKSTEYYLRLTKDIYPSLRKQIEDKTSHIIQVMENLDE